MTWGKKVRFGVSTRNKLRITSHLRISVEDSIFRLYLWVPAAGLLVARCLGASRVFELFRIVEVLPALLDRYSGLPNFFGTSLLKP
jgi:hypothetical protein